jgi:hypothetical protein
VVAAAGGAAGSDERGGGLGGGHHRLEPGDVTGVLGERGGDDQPVLADHVLGVVALDEPAAAHGHQPAVGVGDVTHPARPCAGAGGLFAGGCSGLPGDGALQCGGGLNDPAVVVYPGGAAAPRPPGGITAFELGQLPGAGGAGPV